MARLVSLTLFILSWLLLFSHGFSSSLIPSINCQVCEKVTHQIHQQVQKKEAHKLKVSVLEIIQNICDHRKQEADWIWQIDIVEKELEEKGQCNLECKNIEQECQEVIEKFVYKGVAQFKNRPLNELAKRLCSDACPMAKKEKNSKFKWVADLGRELFLQPLKKLNKAVKNTHRLV